MNKKIAIIGGGLFGLTTYIMLKKRGLECILFEKKKELLAGASTNNLNRVHFGYHYPRDNLTAKQSYKGYQSFRKIYKRAIIKNFTNYYLIAKHSKVSFNNYLKFCKKNKLDFKIIDNSKLGFEVKNIQGGIQVKEPIYDWEIIKKEAKSIINQFERNKIHLNEEVKKIKKINNFKLITNKSVYYFDKIIDASYDGSNFLTKNLNEPIKRKYQLVVVFEFKFKSSNKLGLALMDGKYFSFLPKGKGKQHLLYHVKHSVIKEKISKEFPKSWYNYSNYNDQINKSKKLLLKDLNFYFPNLNINLTNKIYISPRVIQNKVEKTDRRVSCVNEISKNYFQIFSAKIDHSVDIAFKVLKKIQKT